SGLYAYGFCQWNDGTITNCFWDTETSGTETGVGGTNGATGKTTAEMKTKSTFTDAGWDFTTPIWYIGATFNDGYPAFEGVLIPTVTTDPATALPAIGATLNGTLNQDGGEACACGFEWGLSTGYGTTTPSQSKTIGETFSQVIGGLIPNTTYHFRAFATNSAGMAYGNDRTFFTSYWYHLNIRSINLPYEDLDKTKELHILLKNLSPIAKLAGGDGELVIEVKYEPAA
ncbi:unnamed protein product, partial [marine sediment metagenome]